MQRRDFLRHAAIASATLVLAQRAHAQAASGPLFISVEAAGAWDPTFLVDPVANGQATPFAAANILRAGNLSYAPHRLPGEGTGVAERYAFEGEDFFVRWRDAITIFRGVDNATVSHDVGPRVAFAGSSREGRPVMATLAAATAVTNNGGALPPLAFITTGGYAEAAGLVPTTRAGNPTTLLRLTMPNSTRPDDPAEAAQYQPTGVADAVRAYRAGRDQRARAEAQSPRLRRFLDRVLLARSPETDAAFDALAPAMAEAEAVAGPRGSLVPAAASVVGAMRNDACVAAHLDVGGFDTHSDHDDIVEGARQPLTNLLEGLDFIARQVESTPSLSARGVVVLVGSDFGRTFYNGTGAGRGKDHWPITAMMVMALGSAQTLLGGNRVIGETFVGTAKGMLAKRVREQDGGVVTVAGDGGMRLTPALIHQALAEKLAFDSALLNRFKLPELPASPLPFFA